MTGEYTNEAMDRCSSAEVCGGVCEVHGHLSPPPDEETTEDWLLVSSDSLGSRGITMDLEEEEEEEQRGELEEGRPPKLKSKLVSAWNSLKYGWTLKQKSRFSQSSPVTILGHCFQLNQSGARRQFHCSFSSLLWLTYRRGFPPLAGCSLTSDSGWGCVLRTGQMLLAQSLLRHLMPPGWTWSQGYLGVRDDLDLPSTPEGGGAPWTRRRSLEPQLAVRVEEGHRRVVSWFGDHPAAPFGVPRLVELGRSSGKRAGDWYGPSIVAHILRKAVTAAADVPNLAVYVAQDCTIYLEDVRRLCREPLPRDGSLQGSPGLAWKSLLVLVPVRLGGQDLNPSYTACVKRLLMLECCVGIIGGKPKHSLFFIGFQGDYLLYLDPHYCQPTVDVRQEHFPLESFHCKYPRKMSFSRMDPSCTFGFYAKTQKDFGSMCAAVNEALSSCEKYPMFIFSEGPSQKTWGPSEPPDPPSRTRTPSSGCVEEFVLL
ncbi:cysteine protease atg4da-like [Gadus chalcogrammus]|uniref:cysteine protease atg4da-like n=1 Tax=Gadus chalcogrammus TaxID=1042646 RepID=UPI0024C3759D|nr:cysteine protease atg4da-like [Gadus chalcogrammus]